MSRLDSPLKCTRAWTALDATGSPGKVPGGNPLVGTGGCPAPRILSCTQDRKAAIACDPYVLPE